MNNLQGFRLGMGAYSEAMSFIFKNRLGWYFIFPFLFNVLLFVLGIYSVSSISGDVIDQLNAWMAMDQWDFWGASFLAGAVKGFVWLVLRLLFFILFAYIGGYIILILMSPVFALLSEKTEQIINGQTVPFNIKQFMSDILRGVLLAIRNLTVELFFTFILFVISFVPVVGYFTAIALFLISAYFYGFSFMDYTFERRRFKIDASVSFMRRNRGLAIGNGLMFSFVLLIPYVGVMLAGFVSIVSVVAATIAGCKVLDERLS